MQMIETEGGEAQALNEVSREGSLRRAHRAARGSTIQSAKDRSFPTRNKNERGGRRGIHELECVGILENI